MTGRIDVIKNSQFFKHVSVLATGTIIVQSISTLISPILSRFYLPEDYGLFAVFSSVISVLIVICCFRYDLAILIPSKDDEAKKILKLCLLILLLFSFAVFITAVVFNRQLSLLLGNEKLGLWLYFLSPSLFAAGIIQSFTYWFNRKKNYKTISGVRVFQSSANSGFSLLFGFIKWNSFGLILSFIISQFVSFFYVIKKSGIRIGNISINVSELKQTARKFIDYPIYNMPSSLLDTFSIHSIIFFLSYLFSDYITGAYAFSLRILSIPGIVIGASIGQVFFQKISELYNNNKQITGTIISTWKVLILIGIIPMLVLFFWGEDLFTFIFGNNWKIAGIISQYLCFVTFVSFISSPTSTVMLVLKKQKTILLINIITFIYRPLALIYGYKTGNFLNGIILYVILEILQITIYNLIMIRAAVSADNAAITQINNSDK